MNLGSLTVGRRSDEWQGRICLNGHLYDIYINMFYVFYAVYMLSCAFHLMLARGELNECGEAYNYGLTASEPSPEWGGTRARVDVDH
jgi:hypothetical protein